MIDVAVQLLIDGKFVDSASGKLFPVIDPRTGEELIQLAEADAADIDRAVKVTQIHIHMREILFLAPQFGHRNKTNALELYMVLLQK